MDSELQSIGLLETSSVAAGCLAEDRMLKAGSVQLLEARRICSGRYVIVVFGDSASVHDALQSGASVVGATLVLRRQLWNVHPSVIVAISQFADIDTKHVPCVGIIETLSPASCITAANVAMSSADVTLLRVDLAMLFGGKGYALIAGDTPSVEVAVSAAAKAVADERMLEARAVIEAPSEALFRAFI